VIVEVEEVGIVEGENDGDTAFDVGFADAGLVEGPRVVVIIEEEEEVGIEEAEGDTKVG